MISYAAFLIEHAGLRSGAAVVRNVQEASRPAAKLNIRMPVLSDRRHVEPIACLDKVIFRVGEPVKDPARSPQTARNFDAFRNAPELPLCQVKMPDPKIYEASCSSKKPGVARRNTETTRHYPSYAELRFAFLRSGTFRRPRLDRHRLCKTNLPRPGTRQPLRSRQPNPDVSLGR